ncbi:MAG: DNA-3-methyladenine glycosylase, partial [uncultured Quadrisphaera sp.]
GRARCGRHPGPARPRRRPALPLGRHRARGLPRLPRRRVGPARARRAGPVRAAEPRGLPGRAVVADGAAQARRAARGLRRLRPRGRGRLRRARRGAAAHRRAPDPLRAEAACGGDQRARRPRAARA